MALYILVETDQKTYNWPSYQRMNPAAGTFCNLRYFKKLENIENLGPFPETSLHAYMWYFTSSSRF